VSPQKSTRFRLAAPLLIAAVLALVATPAASATSPVTAAPAAKSAPAARGHEVLHLHGDTPREASSARTRRAAFAWKGKRILYTESIPAKWDWSLSTAVAKWNSTGGGIKFVRTTNLRRAKLSITVGNIGGAAGMATLGRRKHASVRLSSDYNNADALDARTRVEVMGIFSHELGHVLGFEHTRARCSLMSPVLDVDGCQVLPPAMPGYYKCRTIDGPLATRFVQVYGGRARFPGPYCTIDPLPAAVSRVAFAGGADSPVTVRWAKPASVPAGSRMEIRSWSTDTCGSVPAWAETAYASVNAGVWQDARAEASGSTCFRVQLVNRYGAGRTAVSQMIVV
jgi:hypothetical protein